VRLLERVCVAAIGKVTARAAGELGLRVDLIPEDSTAASLVEALVRAQGPNQGA